MGGASLALRVAGRQIRGFIFRELHLFLLAGFGLVFHVVPFFDPSWLFLKCLFEWFPDLLQVSTSVGEKRSVVAIASLGVFVLCLPSVAPASSIGFSF